MWQKLVKGTSTFTRAFLPYTSTPAFVILFLHLLFSRSSSFSNIISSGVLSVNSELFTFALLIYFLSIHFPLEVRQLYWQLAGHAIAGFFSFQVCFISASSSPAALGLDFCLLGIKELPAVFFIFW